MGTVTPPGLWRMHDSYSYLPVLHTEFSKIQHYIGGMGAEREARGVAKHRMRGG